MSCRSHGEQDAWPSLGKQKSREALQDRTTTEDLEERIRRMLREQLGAREALPPQGEKLTRSLYVDDGL